MSVIQMRPIHRTNRDPLFLVRPMVDMMQRNFHTKYRPGKELSLDESTCPFKGRVHFRGYNPIKPNRFHIKLFMVSEPSIGYICGLEVYTGDASSQSQGNAQELQDASKNFFHCPRFVRFSTVVGHGSSCLFL